jgi:lysophospholipase
MSAAFDRRSIPAGAVEGTWQAPDGHEIRRIDWPCATPRGSVLFLGGRADFYEKYLEALAHWRGRGWNVTSFDWRGQGGSGRLGFDPYTGHIDDYVTWVADLGAFWRDWRAGAKGPLIVIGHSMGGHLALRAVAEGAIDPARLVLCAPMLGLRDGNLPDGLLHWVAKLMCRIGDPRRPAWKWSEKPGQPPDSRGDLLTHDPERYADELWWREQRPELVMGPGSWGWVERAYASIRWLARREMLARVDQPVLILATERDQLVSFKAIARAARLLPDCRLIRYGEEARHEILREADPVRLAALEQIDTFIDGALP